MTWLEDDDKRGRGRPVRIVDEFLPRGDKREEWKKAIRERVEFWREKLQGPPDELLDTIFSGQRKVNVKIKREKDGTIVVQGVG